MLALPSKVTVPRTTLCNAPALATGFTLALAAVTVVVTMVLSTLPSFTTKLATYTPTASAVNVGLAVLVADKVALLLDGLEIKAQRYVSVSPLASELVLPSKVTVPSTTLWLAPALATGATLAAEAVMLTVTVVLSTLPSFTTKLNT